MADAVKPKTAAKPKSKNDLYERFQQTARDLGVDDESSAERFERAFEKLVPAKRRKSS